MRIWCFLLLGKAIFSSSPGAAFLSKEEREKEREREGDTMRQWPPEPYGFASLSPRVDHSLQGFNKSRAGHVLCHIFTMQD